MDGPLRPVLSIALLCLLSAGSCKTIDPAPALPVDHSVVREQLVLYSDKPLPKQHRLLDDLARARIDVSRTLELPLTNEPIHVYLFNSADAYRGFMERHFPELPERRAFFVETDTKLAVYAHWGDRVAEDLRHEVAHGYLHAGLRNIPLWLDEGLAEYFEVPRGQAGLNAPHRDTLRQLITEKDWRPDIRRLEALTSVNQMQQVYYAEAWAWVHLLLNTDPARRRVLHDYLQLLAEERNAPPLSLAIRQLHYQPEETLLEHLRGLE